MSPEPRLEDIPRIAFVTRRFHDLQGLRTVANAVPPLIFAALLRSSQSARNAIVLGCALVAYVVFRATWIRSGLEAYYSRRLGRVDRSGPHHPDGTLLFAHSFPRARGDRSGPDFIGIFLTYQGLITASNYRDTDLPTFLQVFLILSLLSLTPIRILIHDWRYRAHWLLPLGVGVAFALGLATTAGSQELRTWQVLGCLGYGVALAIAGALDHRLLVTSLGGGARAASMVEHADRI